MTKKEIIERMKSIKKKYFPGSPLRGDDYDFALDVLRHNPDFSWKVDQIRKAGSERLVIAVEKALYGTTCFCLESEDRCVSIPISFYWTDRSMSPDQQISNALREADSERVSEFRKNVPAEFICPFTGETVRPAAGDDFDVDHYDKSVVEIVWSINRVKSQEVMMKYIIQGNGGGCVFVEPLRSKMKDYMAQETKLRYASSIGNRIDGQNKKKLKKSLDMMNMNLDDFQDERPKAPDLGATELKIIGYDLCHQPTRLKTSRLGCPETGD